MDLESKKTFTSSTAPGVTFTLRRLNQRQRAKRDLLIADERMEYIDACRKFVTIQNEWGEPDPDEPTRKRLRQDAPDEASAELRKLDQRITMLVNAHIKPATIKAALLKIDGATLDGKPYTADSFIEWCENDSLIDEVWIEAEKLSGFTIEQSEGFSSPSPSDGPTAGTTSNTTAPSASTGDATETATVASTSPSS